MASSFGTLDLVCDDPFDYWAGLDSVWDTGRTIVNVEHDMEFSDDLVMELLSCPWDLCAYPYAVQPAGWPGLLYGASWGSWVPKDTAFAHFSSIGFCKIGLRVQRGTALPRAVWDKVEGAIHTGAVKNRNLWHLHWPAIGHHHDYSSELPPEESSTYRIVERARAEGRLTVHGPEPTAEELKALDPFLYNESLRRRAEALSPDRQDAGAR